MKKILLILSLVSATAYAQNNYFKAGFCYGFPTSVERFDKNNKEIVDGGSKESIIVGTGGRGTQYTLTYGRKLSSHISFELGVQYFRGAKTQADYYLSIVGLGNINTTYARQGWQVRVIPSLVVSGSNDAKVSPYMRMGLLVPVAGETVTDVKAVYPPVNGVSSEEKQKLVTDGALSIGYNAGVGANIKINEHLGVFGEFTLQSLSAKAKKTTKIEHTKDGSDLLSTQSVSQIETNYVDELTPQSNNQAANPTGFDDTKPTEDLRKYSQYGNVGLNIGVKFAF